MNPMLPLLIALGVSMTLIPLMMRLAPRLGMVDKPDPRKVHARPVPRVGGIGIAFGALLAIGLCVELDRAVLSFVLGSLVLVLFGAWDDGAELGHYVKFIGQGIAAGLVVYWGDVWVWSIPFMEEPLPPEIGKAFSVFALIGMINAMNHSDGLDGLAGGESLLSLCAMAYLAYVAEAGELVWVACAVIGGLVGFLRFNTHPARVFMGDAGSQFLGFAVGCIAVMLTQQANPGLSKALPALLLGLPIVDILAVFAQRAYQGMNWFKATKNHIHHRLLELGFSHYEAVVVIYSIQAFLVLSGVVLCYDSDALILAVYLIVCSVVFVFLYAAERSGWRLNGGAKRAAHPNGHSFMQGQRALSQGSILFIQIGIPLYLVAASLSIHNIPQDASIPVLITFAALAGALLCWSLPGGSLLFRLSLYATAAIVAFLIQQESLPANLSDASLTFFAVLGVSIAVAVRFARNMRFGLTTMDFLIVVLVGAAAIFARQGEGGSEIVFAVVKMVILFYGCELILMLSSRHWNRVLSGAAALALGIMSLKLLF